MNAKEKAIEIAMEFEKYGETDNAIQCAIIHVKGVIEVLNKGSMRVNLRSQTPEYWQEVLTELNQM